MGISAKEMSKRLQPLLDQQHLKNLVNIEIINNEDTLIAIKKNEYQQGNIYSSEVRRTYAGGVWDFYRQEKMEKNPRAGGFVDLIYSGAFIGAFELIEKGKGLFFKSNDWKYDLLEKKYNNSASNIFNLNKDVYNAFINKYVVNDFIKVLKKQLGQ